MEVNWSTIECIGKTGAVDLWLLFPLSAANRLLTRGGTPPDSWGDNLTRLFGTDEWKAAFYPTRTDQTLFGTEVSQLKQADFRTIGDFFVSRLKTSFTKVAEEPRVLFSSRNVPLFLFCFAAANPGRGGDIALRIAQHILKM
jgi:three-Cys-motif partner protein